MEINEYTNHSSINNNYKNIAFTRQTAHLAPQASSRLAMESYVVLSECNVPLVAVVQSSSFLQTPQSSEAETTLSWQKLYCKMKQY